MQSYCAGAQGFAVLVCGLEVANKLDDRIGIFFEILAECVAT